MHYTCTQIQAHEPAGPQARGHSDTRAHTAQSERVPPLPGRAQLPRHIAPQTPHRDTMRCSAAQRVRGACDAHDAYDAQSTPHNACAHGTHGTARHARTHAHTHRRSGRTPMCGAAGNRCRHFLPSLSGLPFGQSTTGSVAQNHHACFVSYSVKVTLSVSTSSAYRHVCRHACG